MRGGEGDRRRQTVPARRWAVGIEYLPARGQFYAAGRPGTRRRVDIAAVAAAAASHGGGLHGDGGVAASARSYDFKKFSMTADAPCGALDCDRDGGIGSRAPRARVNAAARDDGGAP